MSEVAAAPSAAPAAPSSTPAAPSQTSAPTSAPAAPTAGQSKDSAPDAVSAAPTETPAEKAERIRLKLKLDGKEEDREFTHDELALRVQKGFGAEKRFEEASRVQKQFQEYLSLVEKGDLEGAFKVLNPKLNARQLAEAYLRPMYEKEMMPEQERQRFEEQQELERYRTEDKQRKEKATKDAQEKADREAWAVMEKDWVAALEKSGLGPNKYFVHEMLKIGLEFNARGVDLAPEQIIVEMKERMGAQQKQVLRGLKGDALVKYLGDDVINEIMNHKIAQIKASKPAQEPIKPPASEKFEPDQPKERFTKSYTSMKEFSKYLNGK